LRHRVSHSHRKTGVPGKQAVKAMKRRLLFIILLIIVLAIILKYGAAG